MHSERVIGALVPRENHRGTGAKRGSLGTGAKRESSGYRCQERVGCTFKQPGRRHEAATQPHAYAPSQRFSPQMVGLAAGLWLQPATCFAVLTLQYDRRPRSVSSWYECM